MNARTTAARAAAGFALAVGLIALSAAPATAAGTATGSEAPTPAPVTPAESDNVVRGEAYPGDPELEATLVANEERRLVEVRAIANAAGWTGASANRPFRLVTGNAYTLVLIEREAPYTISDLLELAPSTFVQQPDGSYLLSENIIVDQGATLSLTSRDALRLHLTSTPDLFVSIASLGGAIQISGTPEKRAEVVAWDSRTDQADTTTSDGRAYVRVSGGTARFANVDFHDLGFWSGRTGGVSLTGTSDGETVVGQTVRGDASTGTTVYGNEIFPTGSDAAVPLDATPDLGAYSFVSADIDSVTARDNAYGMFITSARGVDIRDSTFDNNLVDGLVLHREVEDAVIHNSSASNNAVDGITVARAATGVVLSRATVEANGRNGITLEGGALADGPNPVGASLGSFGGNEVSDSKIAGNGRYGIELLGGANLTVDGNAVSDQTMGIVVASGVSDVSITGNIVERSTAQAIALRDGVTGALVQANDISGGEVGIFLRDAAGRVDRNTIVDTTSHAITVISAAGDTDITRNSVAGRGASAIDTARAGDGVAITMTENDVDAWVSTKPLDVVLRSIFQPLTVMWLTLGLLVVITAVTGVRARRRDSGIRNPYASHTPLSALTAGVVDPSTLGRTPARGGTS
ncbi:hypothetical protein MSA03_26780 [Microbacterium saccharophilum]|uniref:right-handed parallel beta-helix repeat-containing protein n=1 Tax=Microbacterium saccharophilum TaxID=1213358 RepID=UPI00119649EB|nr:right-handed parallel beta-helix repeat-containing protein [Microbacterium saccharophilum]GEP49170.1 hypothetical protein MSA03_26780 [Microbacterium saccharophilum]